MTEFIEHLHEVFADFGRITVRRMFGGHGIYHDGLMFALVSDQSLYLKADAETRQQFTDRGLQPFQYSKKGNMLSLSYFLAPEEIFEESEVAASWARLSYGAALRAQKPRARKKTVESVPHA